MVQTSTVDCAVGYLVSTEPERQDSIMREPKMMNYEGANASGAYAILKDKWQKSQNENGKLTFAIIYSKVQERYRVGVYG